MNWLKYIIKKQYQLTNKCIICNEKLVDDQQIKCHKCKSKRFEP